MQQTKRTRRTFRAACLLTGVGVLAATLAACGGDDGDSTASGDASAGAATSAAEQQGPTPRLALSYDGGIIVVDAASMRQVADLPVEGFIRLNTAANGRHVFVSESDGFRVLDMGTWTRKHGDHGHHYVTTPRLTEMRFGGAEPGHVVPHDSRITLFSDGTGQVDIVEPAELLRGNAKATSFTVPTPHHGVAVARGDGSLVVTVGNEDSRSGIAILDRNRAEVARNDQCPGVHGEAAASDGVLTFGCQDGILVVRGNEIRKIASPDAYGRIGNQAGAEDSPIVFGDYKTDADAEIERPNRFSLTDTRTGTLRIVPFASSYSFRSIERGPGGDAVLLGTDGAVHVIDTVTATTTRRIPVIGAWAEPERWQSAMPNIFVQGPIAYVSDPATKTLTAVNLTTGEKVGQMSLPHPTIELTGVTG
ncbi:zinc metallochaperone AztD [Gordonia sp. ABSL1-1]|uniref:zinc metallochaperone AztD n=1 Tax=Gordonia sp. ABSL1-1 TaxID=3053923 RepID=UPI0025739919|nr:zinc metallochaperone AztD [Gordonia sp. ABSL1-1]MDL9938185.1 zinc metallochaperone AztD [Gordonia sp. ABSL1-1]